MKKYRYVIVCLNGRSHDLFRETDFAPLGLGSTPRYDLSELLRKGWQPVRETPMGSSGQEYGACSLVLLEKEAAPAPPVLEPAEE
jgi:hypothetical protein